MTIDALAALEAHLRSLPTPWAPIVAEGLAQYLAGDAESLDAALNLKCGPGQRKPPTVLRTAERDRLFRQAAEQFDLSAAVLARRLDRFATTVWPRCSSMQECPKHFVGRLDEFLFFAMRAWSRPISARQMRDVIKRR